MGVLRLIKSETKYKENRDKDKETKEYFHESSTIKKYMLGKWRGTSNLRL